MLSKSFGYLAALLAFNLGTQSPLSAAVHYFLLQGEFNSTTSGLETYKWRVEDDGNTLQTGQDLLHSIFGTPDATPGPVSTIGAGFRLDYTYYEAGADYPASFFLTGITKLNLSGVSDDVTLEADFGAGLGWTNYLAGGNVLPSQTDYADGVWTWSSTGTSQRSLLDSGVPEVTFDGWVYGKDGFVLTPLATITGNNSPVAGNFTGTGTLVQSYGNGVKVYDISAVPEPQMMFLLLGGFAAMTLRRRRGKISHF